MDTPKIRLFPFLAFLANLVALILALLVLLQDITHVFITLQEDAILTYNVSHIGRNHTHYGPELATLLRDLIPENALNGASVTRYLGGYDWYSLYHFYVCQGWYTVDEATGLLTGTKINTSCERFPGSYVFDLHETLESTLHSSVAELLADDIPTCMRKDYTFNVKAPTALLIVGIIFASTNTVAIAYTLSGHLHVNRIPFAIAYLALFPQFIAAAIDTVYAGSAKAWGIGDLCSSFLAMIWVMAALAIFSVCMVQIEVYLEYWTPLEQPIVLYSRPKDLDMNWWTGRSAIRMADK